MTENLEKQREYKKMNDECADKIADNRYSIDNSRDWLVEQGGVVDRVHRMSSKNVSIELMQVPGRTQFERQ